MTPLQAADLLIPEPEIAAMTGYKQPSRQVSALRRQGFHRARLNRNGVVVLERAHYDAVCQAQSGHDHGAPQLRFV